jgi:hypothetical protein
LVRANSVVYLRLVTLIMLQNEAETKQMEWSGFTGTLLTVACSSVNKLGLINSTKVPFFVKGASKAARRFSCAFLRVVRFSQRGVKLQS